MNRSSLLERPHGLDKETEVGKSEGTRLRSLNNHEVSTMEKTNQSKNKSTTYRVSPDTVAFMMASGFSPEGNWYKWAKKNGEAVDNR
jgi:hypothetical protein